MDNKQRKIIRKAKNEKNATKGKGQPEFKLDQKEQYILGRANQALGVAKTNQGAVNDINVSIEANTNRINVFDDKMKTWDTELTDDLKSINEKIETIIDVIITHVDANELDEKTLKILGLESVEVEEEVLALPEAEEEELGEELGEESDDT